MNRKIIGFNLDQESHWVARLDCGHCQHVRHQPPLVSRPWVLTEDGRATYLGSELYCVRCDALEFPVEVEWIRETAVFDQNSLPAALQREHRTAVGVWGRIVVLKGSITYSVAAPVDRSMHLNANSPGIVAPQIAHHLTVTEPVELKVQFYQITSAA